MYSQEKIIDYIKDGNLDETLKELYVVENSSDLDQYRNRYIDAINGLNEEFRDNEFEEIGLFSAPGRTEIGGNHTDHQLGSVLAGSVNYDVIAAVKPNDLDRIRLFSEGYGLTDIELNDLEPKENEEETTAALIRGMAGEIKRLGNDVKGFDAYVISNVPSGSGISSSAAFEVLLGNIINSLFVNGELDPVEIAKLSQITENKYFGKPSGLMDQMASSVGGIVAIDFGDINNPIIEKVDLDLDKHGYSLVITDSKSSHADLTPEYAAIPEEMKSVAKYFGKDYLSEIDEEEFHKNISNIRKELSDRAVLRAIHYLNDTQRAKKEAEAIKQDDFEEFLRLVNESGNSSVLSLQNINPPGKVDEQAVALALSLANMVLNGEGASRVHGGGFAGTIQAFVPKDKVDVYVETLNNTFGDDSCKVMSIRPIGGTKVL